MSVIHGTDISVSFEGEKDCKPYVHLEYHSRCISRLKPGSASGNVSNVIRAVFRTRSYIISVMKTVVNSRPSVIGECEQL
jgi:hypothetical protein